MDNVTHSLVGLMLARAAGSRSAYTSAMTVVAANLPDVDAFSLFAGGTTYIEYHRGYTHSLALAPLLALIPPLLFIWKQKFSARIYLLALVAVFSHLLLDWTNVYGIRLLLPFSSRWPHLDITDIVDPWILLLLILAVAAPALSRMVSTEISSRSGAGPKRGWAWFALLALLAYEGGRYTLHQRALAVMGAHLFNGTVARRLSTLPARFNPLTWRGVAEGEGFVVLVPVNVAEAFDPTAGRIEYAANPSPVIEAARRTRAFESFERFNQLPFWKVTPLDDLARVELIDLRFGTPQFPGFEATALVDSAGQVRESRFGFGPPPVATR
jgi:inner membrane protein